MNGQFGSPNNTQDPSDIELYMPWTSESNRKLDTIICENDDRGVGLDKDFRPMRILCFQRRRHSAEREEYPHSRLGGTHSEHELENLYIFQRRATTKTAVHANAPKLLSAHPIPRLTNSRGHPTTGILQSTNNRMPNSLRPSPGTFCFRLGAEGFLFLLPSFDFIKMEGLGEVHVFRLDNLRLVPPFVRKVVDDKERGRDVSREESLCRWLSTKWPESQVELHDHDEEDHQETHVLGKRCKSVVKGERLRIDALSFEALAESNVHPVDRAPL